MFGVTKFAFVVLLMAIFAYTSVDATIGLGFPFLGGGFSGFPFGGFNGFGNGLGFGFGNGFNPFFQGGFNGKFPFFGGGGKFYG